MKLLAGNSNRTLAQAIANYLDLPLTKAQVRKFADNELFVAIDENVRGEDVFLIQSTSFPANDHLMELLICIDALTRASARRNGLGPTPVPTPTSSLTVARSNLVSQTMAGCCPPS